MRRLGVTAALFPVAGALAGVLWFVLWTPPQGVALGDEFVFTSAGLPEAFDGTAIYVLLAVALGLVLGVVAGLRSDGTELAALATVGVASVVAGLAMALVGHALGPDDADDTARGLDDYTAVEDDLHVEGIGAYLALPTGALLGAGGVFMSVSTGRDRRRSGDDGDTVAAEGAADGAETG